MQNSPTTPNEKQLELDFGSIALVEIRRSNNVVHAQFGQPKLSSLGDKTDDQVLIDLILQSAQKLKW